MVHGRGRRRIDVRKSRLVTAFALAMSLASLGAAAPALATEHHPKGKFAPFVDCPLSNPAVELCIFAETKNGGFVVGKKTVPISKTVILQGGSIENPVTGALTLVAAEDGNTLSKTPLTVPGGLLGIVAPSFLPKFLQEAFNEFINKGIAGVTATTELARPASQIQLNTQNLIFEEGVALQLPVKVKLDNPLLGSSCYIGSSSNPIILNLTTGTTSPPAPNKPIRGASGELEILEEAQLVRLVGGALVDNAFAAPKVNGCGGIFSFLIDPAVDAVLGTPSAAGKNASILKGNLEQATAMAVKASE